MGGPRCLEVPGIFVDMMIVTDSSTRIIFGASSPSPVESVDSMNSMSPTVPHRRVSIPPKPPTFQESRLPVHAAIGDLVTCVDCFQELSEKLIPGPCESFKLTVVV